MHGHMRTRNLTFTSAALAVSTLACVAALALSPASAVARSNLRVSTNWSGFVAGGPGVHFRSVSAQWRQPRPRCARNRVATTSTWVGLGGLSSEVLEQTGTQFFCVHGRTATGAWYELLPAPAMFLRMRIFPGDLMSARVTVAGHRVTMSLRDLSDGESFVRTFRAPHISTDSADWIQEAPTACGRGGCHIVRLANFGTVHFSHARAQGVRGRYGSIAARAWQHIRLMLVQTGRGFINVAVPSRLARRGSAFTVTYHSGG
jgi:hypothetical protein